MKILVNGKEETLAEPMTVKAFLREKNWGPASVVVELNREIIDKESWRYIVLKHNDQMEILHFVGGGKTYA